MDEFDVAWIGPTVEGEAIKALGRERTVGRRRDQLAVRATRPATLHSLATR